MFNWSKRLLWHQILTIPWGENTGNPSILSGLVLWFPSSKDPIQCYRRWDRVTPINAHQEKSHKTELRCKVCLLLRSVPITRQTTTFFLYLSHHSSPTSFHKLLYFQSLWLLLSPSSLLLPTNLQVTRFMSFSSLRDGLLRVLTSWKILVCHMVKKPVTQAMIPSGEKEQLLSPVTLFQKVTSKNESPCCLQEHNKVCCGSSRKLVEAKRKGPTHHNKFGHTMLPDSLPDEAEWEGIQICITASKLVQPNLPCSWVTNWVE